MVFCGRTMYFSHFEELQNMSLMVSISGVRGVVGKTLTPEVVVRYTAGFAAYAGSGPIILGRDGRITGSPIANIVSSTLLSMGRDVIALGVVPTPTIGLAVELEKAAGGISVTASHNPIEWNGMKFIGPRGIFLTAGENAELWPIVDQGVFPFAGWKDVGGHRRDESYIEKHIAAVLRLPSVRADAVRSRKFRVVVDCINAAGGSIVPQLLSQLGCTVIPLNADVSGVFARPPEPLPENLGELALAVKTERADLGIAVDPDVDRLVFIMENGEPFGEEYTVASVIDYILGTERVASPSVVVNLSTTRAVDDIAARHGAKVFRSPVGEINVAEKMRETGAIAGGEGSGGVIHPGLHFMRDAIAGIGLVLSHLAGKGGTLSDLKKSLPGYIIRKTAVGVAGKDTDKLLDSIAGKMESSARINRDDGIKFDFDDGWVHLRKSNTEPIIRIIAEGPTAEDADRLLDRFRKELD